RAEVEHHGFEIYRYMAALRNAGLEFVGMSSVGPAIAVITDRPEEEVATILSSVGLQIAIVTGIDNEGLKIRVEEKV
ncbi:MAG: GHMP kinase, partial [Methanomicrobiales archaeon]|nr:GHMP kinase [Methanomicrobiales archaeon]